MRLMWVCLILITLLAVYLLGYFARVREERKPRKPNLSRDYLRGINLLLNDETDKAVDVFIKVLEVDSDTVETHLAVAKLFRRRGEVDRAIRIHQNLIARPQLEKRFHDQSLYELGLDYRSAGVLDRAEKIFQDLIKEPDYTAKALKTLLDIYQQEKNWLKAIDAAIQYEAVTRQNMQPVIAHYYCELADIAVAKKRTEHALEYLHKALYADNACIRASLMTADRMIEKKDYKTALDSLKSIKEMNPDYLSEAIERMARCYEALGNEDKFVIYLKRLLEEYPHVPVVLILAERIRKWKGDKVAAEFVTDYVRRYPSLKGLALFVDLYIANTEGKAKDDLGIIQNLMKKLLADKPDYQCQSCGFSGKTLHWQCPGCKQWGTILPTYSLEESVV